MFIDAHYADKASDRRSVSSIKSIFGGACCESCYYRKMQHLVSLSTSEAEYIAAEDGVKEDLPVFVNAVLSFVAPGTYGVSTKVPENNQGGKASIENPRGSAERVHRRAVAFYPRILNWENRRGGR